MVTDHVWTTISFARIARKHRLKIVAARLIQRLYHLTTMDAADFFYKLCEQVKICFDDKECNETALKVLNLTNLQYFNPEQKAELFRLKGEILNKARGAGDPANAAYSSSISVCWKIL